MGNTSSRTQLEPSESATPPPPRMHRPETFEQKLYRKLTTEPLVPLGAGVTAYFLISGLRAFNNKDAKKSQRMMRMRVMAQFATLVCLIGYMGPSADWRVAPFTQEKLQQQKEQQNNSDKE